MWKKNKTKNLSAYKEYILREINYYEKRIQEFHSNTNTAIYYESSSESDNETPLKLDTGSIRKLKQQETELRTRFQATKELAEVQVSQSEVNLMVKSPKFVGAAPITDEGTWREVIAECKVDHIPFTISFYIYEPNSKFAPTLYRGLRVRAVKKAHELELEKSILPTLTSPSDAVEVLKSYAEAVRSRRTTLSHLAETYGEALFMQPLPTGGYMLKCTNLMEVSWVLVNKWSPIAPFHHKMAFDLEYMDASYIKTISQIYKQLSNPLISTDERTMLLSKIIATCLEALGPSQELYESMESDQETAQKLLKRRTTLDQEPEEPIMKRREENANNERENGEIKKNNNKIKAKNVIQNKNSNKNVVENDKTAEKNITENNQKENEVMAPPKSLPKRKKPTGKENIIDNPKSDNKILKRSNTNEDIVNPKKTKTIDEVDDNRADKVNNTNTVSKETTVKSQNGVAAKNNDKLIQNKNKVIEDKQKSVVDQAVVSNKNSTSKTVNTNKVIEKVKKVKTDNSKQSTISTTKVKKNINSENNIKNNTEPKIAGIKLPFVRSVAPTVEKNTVVTAKNKDNLTERTDNKVKINEKIQSDNKKIQPKKGINSTDLNKINKLSKTKNNSKNVNSVEAVNSKNVINTKIPMKLQTKHNTDAGDNKTSSHSNINAFKVSNINKTKVQKLPKVSQKKPLIEENVTRHSPRINHK